MRSTSVIRYLSVAVIVIILAALSAWYFFIRAKQAAIEQADAGRGAGLSTQPPASPSGSTYENIVSSLSSVFTGGEINENTKEVPRLAQVNKSPTAGAGFVGSSTSTRLRFVERGTGFIFDIAPETLALERLTNVLVPRTYEALVAENDHLIMRGIEEDGHIDHGKRKGTRSETFARRYPIDRYRPVRERDLLYNRRGERRRGDPRGMGRDKAETNILFSYFRVAGVLAYGRAFHPRAKAHQQQRRICV